MFSRDQQAVNLTVLVGGKGRGSNMRAIAEACASGAIPARVALVIAPSPEIPAVQAAQDLGLSIRVVDPRGQNYEQQLLAEIESAETDFLCLAGYLRLLPKGVLDAYPNRVLNIHPALLPKHGGKGMYGMRVHQAVIDSGDDQSGCSVHLVNEHYDEGAILLQLPCFVVIGDTAETLAARVLELEHRAYPLAIAQLIEKHGRKRQANPAL